MTSLESKNEMEVMVLSDLAAICAKLAESSVVPEKLRMQARQFVAEFNALSPVRGEGTASQHFAGEALLTRIARFLPRVTEVEAVPAKVLHP